MLTLAWEGIWGQPHWGRRASGMPSEYRRQLTISGILGTRLLLGMVSAARRQRVLCAVRRQWQAEVLRAQCWVALSIDQPQ